MRRVPLFAAVLTAMLLTLAGCQARTAALPPEERPEAAFDTGTENTAAPSPEASGNGAVSAETASGASKDRDAILCSYYNEALVSAHLRRAEGEKQDIAGAIVPHYAPAMTMTADALSAVTDAPDTVVVIGPNHAGHGGLIQICGKGYRWSGSGIGGDDVLARDLAAALGMETTDAAAREDWSASIQMPYVAHFFPESRVVTVLLARGADAGQLRTLARLLSEAAADRALLVLGSADFSHYQDPDTARVCDGETAQIIADGEIDRLLRLGNDHIDSPETAAVLLLYGQALDKLPVQADGLFETFVQDGKPMAGSYYEYLFK